MSDFDRVLAGLHAEGRLADKMQTLRGAYAVAAEAYPHQIDSVHRMLTAPTCRFLLADEVGLGKTVQAIMVMKGLAASRTEPLAVALTVPDDLVAQWEEELLCRGDVVALDNGEAGASSGNVVIRLLRPSKLLAGAKIASSRIDLLLVDEFTRLQVQVRRELISAARSIPNVVVMTATPALHLAANRRELFALLEPEAADEANATGVDILKVLRDRETDALAQNDTGIPDVGRERLLASSYGMYRRVIRTARSDYPGVLPRRRYQPFRVKPTDGDVARARATRHYIEAARRAGVELRAEALLQVSGRSPQSLRDRLSTLKRGSGELTAAWRGIDSSLRDEWGDAKLDALIDHLRLARVKRPDGRIVVVAEDNPTTDYLRDAIEKLGGIRTARKRRTVSSADELDSHIVSLKDAMDDFISGEAAVLVATDAAKEGHNLQFADEIVFFALPWSPMDIQQWIGRIDRLGARDALSGRTITITPIVTEGSIEDNILRVLEETGVFERSEVFDEAEWREINKAIDAAASGREGGSWSAASREAATFGGHRDDWMADSAFGLTRRNRIAMERLEELRQRSYVLPLAAAGSHRNWFRDRERGVELMIRLARQDYLDVRNQKDRDQKFRTVWYKTKPAEDGLSIADLDPRSSGHRKAFITRRTDLDFPPRPSVKEGDGRSRKLHFLDHGDALHDGLVKSLVQLAPPADVSSEFVVAYGADHPALAWEGKSVLLAWGRLEVPIRFLRDISGEFDPDSSLSKPEQDARLAVLRMAVTHGHADQRWLDSCCPPEILLSTVAASREDGIQSVKAAAAILDPFHDKQAARLVTRRRPQLPDDKIKAARDALRLEMRKNAEPVLRRFLKTVRSSLADRIFEIEADKQAHLKALAAIVQSTAALDQNYEFNRAASRGTQLHLALAERAFDDRLERLKSIEDNMKNSTQFTRTGYIWVAPRTKDDF
ncbi:MULTISPECIES: DEAD/DEAH box helicase [Rhizobium]|uniref:DEAD/DEAH box helicase n=1 Tax=Rhizobium TaxID=379 RepID=UPI001C90EAC3|nr:MULTISPECIES: DEAD/DEAH box helicase [Rhizobium]MBY3081865.1 DEAD/DEAH box helicase [Rhizobium laguerreae]MBY3271368.1 DEAD/DEAH box helicase [Rhizobium laguerreae]MBY3294457.1 DEAD/DEAH box helicase [Rhizobium laguerreae]MBY3327329.1 DEAD/DEAH box helicase [Rhizobium laguerreae]MBY5740983.1 DEAD/DEAH box helicase [Rhizobium leguminosarum]